jgi:hypothetical protein
LSEARRVLGRLLAPALLLGMIGSAEAQEAVRFQYEAPAECPSAEGFVARVRERTARGRLAEPGELARTFRVEVRSRAGGYAGEIEFLDDAGANVSRRLQGEQCEAVVSSLALITALALDATLREQEHEPEAESEPAPPSRPAPAPATAAASTAPPPPPRRMEPSLTGARIGLRGGYGSAIDAPDVGILGELTWRRGLSLRLDAHVGWDQRVVDPGREAKLWLRGIATSVCPWRLRTGELAFAPCAGLDLGLLHAEGIEGGALVSAKEDTILWAAVGLELRAAWEPDVPFWFELRGAAEFPLPAGHEFRFAQPTKEVLRVPWLAGSGSAAAGVRFW